MKEKKKPAKFDNIKIKCLYGKKKRKRKKNPEQGKNIIM